MKNNQSEMTEMNSTLERINISLNEAENRISNLEDHVLGTIQTEQQKEKKIK